MDRVPGLREATDDDGPGLIALVGGVFDEYPGCVLDLDDLDADLISPATSFREMGASLWVLPGDDRLLACVGLGPTRPEGLTGPVPTAELKRLYVTADARGHGLGNTLIEFVHDQAREAGAEQIELWSDTRFLAGHRAYERAGYRQLAITRDLNDPSNTTETAFTRPL